MSQRLDLMISGVLSNLNGPVIPETMISVPLGFLLLCKSHPEVMGHSKLCVEVEG